MEEIIILGAGGHAASVIDSLERGGKYDIIGYIVNDERAGNSDYPIVGMDSDLECLYQRGIRNIAIGIGYLGKSDLREKLYKHVKAIGFSLPVISDPSAMISQHAEIAEGTFIGKGAIINSGAVIKEACIINSGAIVEHDCKIDEFSHISVGSVLCGGVCVGKATFVGANATVIQEKKIGSNCVLGAGITIRKDIEDGCIVWNKDQMKSMRIS